MPFFFLQYTALPTSCNYSPFLFRVVSGECPSPFLSGGAFHMTASVTRFLCSKVAGWGPPFLPSLAALFIYSLSEGVPLPLSLELRAPHPLCYMSLFFQLLVYYYVCFFLFSLGRVILSRGWCWFVPGSTVCCLFAHLVICVSQTG
jgi:hypothetical protein